MSEAESGTFEICPVCNCEDDNVHIIILIFKGELMIDPESEIIYHLNFK